MSLDIFRQRFRLASLTPRLHRLPLAEPLCTAAGLFRQRELVIIEAVICVDGHSCLGRGEAAPLSGWSRHSTRQVLNQARHTGLESRELNLEELHHDPGRVSIPVLQYAIATAILDALSTRLGRGCAQLLAGVRGIYPQLELPVQCTLGCSETETTLFQVGRACEQGFTTVKLKVGAGPIEQDLDRIRRIADAFPGMELRLDANGAWDQQEALRALEEMPVSLIEQPVPPGKLAGLLQARTRPWPLIAADESCSSAESAQALIEHGQIDALVLKPCTLGSPVRIFELLDQAHRRGIDVIFSNLMESAIGRAAAAAMAAAWPELPGPHGLATAGWFSRDLAPGELICNGRLKVPARAGHVPCAKRGIAT